MYIKIRMNNIIYDLYVPVLPFYMALKFEFQSTEYER